MRLELQPRRFAFRFGAALLLVPWLASCSESVPRADLNADASLSTSSSGAGAGTQPPATPTPPASTSVSSSGVPEANAPPSETGVPGASAPETGAPSTSSTEPACIASQCTSPGTTTATIAPSSNGLGGSGGRGPGPEGEPSSGAGGTGGAPALPEPALQAPDATYNGLRGVDFNDDWKFKRGDSPGAEQTEFDDSQWRTLDVPHDFSIELEFNPNSAAGSSGGYLDGGIGWYRKRFSLDSADSAKRVLVQFDGVYMNSQVWVNGTSLGTRPYGYSSFEYDLTPYVEFGTNNVIAVKVNNQQPNSRWYSGSGIYRNVRLLQLDPVHIPSGGVFVTTPSINGDSATVALDATVLNQAASTQAANVSVSIRDALGVEVAAATSEASEVAVGAQATLHQELSIASPELWSLTSPYLYRVQVDVHVGDAVVDSYVTRLGVRSFTFGADDGFALNGEAIKLHGVNMHHDLGALGSAVNYRAIERQVEILKGMGVNAIRTSHNPAAPELLDITDRLGVLVMEEAFDTWTEPKTTNDYSVHFADWAERDIQDMVRRDRNHPSIVLWSIGNEISGATTAIAQSLHDWVVAIDMTRPVTWASNKMSGPHYDPVDHEIAELLDVAGYNYANYAGDYDADHKDHPTWKLLGSETSAAVRSRGIYRTPAGTVTKWNEGTNSDRQCSSYDNETARFGDTAEGSYSYDNERAFVAGSFIWAGFDYIGEPTPYSSWPSKSSYYGIVDTAGFPKDVYYFYQSRWTTTPMVHLLPHWNWTSGTEVAVYAYSNCDEVELFLNDDSLGTKSMSSALHAEWQVPWAPGTLRADCRTGGEVLVQHIVKTAGAAAKIALFADRATIRADGKDLVFVTADIQDETGVFVPNASPTLSIDVSGAGELVGLDNGNPVDTTSYKSTSKQTFSGKLLAIVRATRETGSIEIRASGMGLREATLSLTANTSSHAPTLRVLPLPQ